MSSNQLLTPREIEVLTLIAQGMTSKQAADKLFVEKRTVDYHLSNAYRTLGASNRVAAINKANQLGLIQQAA